LAEASATRPKVEARFFNGLAIVVAASTLLWWLAGVVEFSGQSKTEDVLSLAFFALLFAIALGVATYVIALGPCALLSTIALTVGDRLDLSQRLTARLAAPLVAWIAAVSLLVLFVLLTVSVDAIDLRVVMEVMLFALPTAVIANIYASFAWPKGTGT
jgi:hypothetical protein